MYLRSVWSRLVYPLHVYYILGEMTKLLAMFIDFTVDALRVLVCVTRLRRPTIGVDVQLGNRLGSDRSVS
jgi:hypothetical protein